MPKPRANPADVIPLPPELRIPPDSGPDAQLLADLARLAALDAELKLAKKRDRDSYYRAIRRQCQEMVETHRRVATTRAQTRAGAIAKLMHALADEEDWGGSFIGMGRALPVSAMRDALRLLDDPASLGHDRRAGR